MVASIKNTNIGPDDQDSNFLLPKVLQSQSHELIDQEIGRISARTIGSLELSDKPLRSLFPPLSLRPQSEIPEENRRIAMRQQKLIDKIEPPLSAKTPEARKVKKCYEEMCGVLGVEKDIFTVTVAASDVPNAYVNLIERRISLTTTLLEVLNNDESLIKAVIGHELSHVLLAHYDDSAPIFTVPDEKELEEKIEYFAIQKARSFDEEYQADRLSCLALAFTGAPPLSMVAVLRKIEEWRVKYCEENETEDEFGLSMIPWAVDSHPVTQRRIQSLTQLVRNLPVVPLRSKHDSQGPTAEPTVDTEDIRGPSQYIVWPDRFISQLHDESDSESYDPIFDELAETATVMHTDFNQLSPMFQAVGTYDFSSKEMLAFTNAWTTRFGGVDVENNFFARYQHGRDMWNLRPMNNATFKLLPDIVSVLKDCKLWDKINDKRVLDPKMELFDLMPDEVNAVFSDPDASKEQLEEWKKETRIMMATDKEITPDMYARAWWGQAMNRSGDCRALADIGKDISEYSIDAVRGLMQGFSADEWPTLYKTSMKSTFSRSICFKQTPAITSLLCKKWLECREDNVSELENIRLLFQELDQYWDDKGHAFPLNLRRIVFALNDVFMNGDDERKAEVAALVVEYSGYFTMHENGGSVVDLCEPLYWAAEAQGIALAQRSVVSDPVAEEILKTSNIIDIPFMLRDIPGFNRQDSAKYTVQATIQSTDEEYCTAASATRVKMSLPKQYDEQQIQDRLLDACTRFSFPDRVSVAQFQQAFLAIALPKIAELYTHAIRDPAAARLFIQEKIVPGIKKNRNLAKQISNNAKDEEMQDRLREVDLSDRIVVLGQDEFERQYLTEEGRKEYSKMQYAEIDRGAPLLHEVERIWRLGHYEEFSDIVAQGAAENAISYLDLTFPIPCALRDQVLVETLPGAHRKILNTMEDMTQVLDLISKNERISYLLMMLEKLDNAFLKNAVSNQLYSLYLRSGSDAFLSQVPQAFIERLELSTGPGTDQALHDQAPLCLLVCFPDPSYRRDELLTPLIDSASSWKQKQSIAGLSSDPAFGSVGRRNEKNVMVHESLFSAFQKLKSVDKAETLMYLLGSRDFITGFDNEFRNKSQVDFVNEMRWDKVLSRKRERDPFLEEHLGFRMEKEKKKTSYFIGNYPINTVSEPDTLIHLQKNAGIPIDLVFKQHNVAVSHREQLDTMTEVLLGDSGVLRTPHRDALLKQIAHLMVNQGTLTNDDKDKPAVESLIAVALCNCPDPKLPAMFLDMWHLSASKDKKPLPEIVAKMMQKAGPIFVVAAQYLAHQTHSLSPEWAGAFRSCVDENKLFDSTLIDAHISGNLGGNPFADIHEKKGEGSKAVVNRASLPDGRNCAVKIFHGFIAAELPEDIRLLKCIVDHVNAHPDQFHVHLPDNLPEVVQAKMVRQIDPKSETEGLAALKSVLSKSLLGVKFATADCYAEHSANSVLTYSYSDGVSLDKNEELTAMGFNEAKQRTMRNATGLEVVRQILTHGTYQSDPNIGNFLVAKDGVVHWVDYGSMETLSTEDRQMLAQLLKAIVKRSTPVVGKMLAPNDALAIQFAGLISEETKDQNTGQKIATWISENHAQFSIANVEGLLKGLQDMCAREGYVFNPQWVSIIGALSLLKPLLVDCPKESYSQVLAPLMK